MYQAMTPGIDIYGIEVKPVKSKRELPQELAERLALPEEPFMMLRRTGDTVWPGPIYTSLAMD